MSAFGLARARIASLAPRWLRPHRSVEVRVIVGGVEEDRFVASHPNTLVRALRPIYAHLDGRPGYVELTGVETSRWPLRVRSRQTPLAAGPEEAIRFLIQGC